MPVHGLNEAIQFTITSTDAQLLQMLTNATHSAVACTWWDETTLSWTGSGVVAMGTVGLDALESTPARLVCGSNHLSVFSTVATDLVGPPRPLQHGTQSTMT